MASPQNNSNSNAQAESFGDKMARQANNCMQSTGLCCFKVKEQSQITALEFKITQRQKRFGVDYLTLVENRASQDQLRQCLEQAKADIQNFQHEIDNHYDIIEDRTGEVQTRIQPTPGSNMPSATAVLVSPHGDTTPQASTTNNNSRPAKNTRETGHSPPSNTKKKTGRKAVPQAAAIATSHDNNDEKGKYGGADPSRWKCKEMKFEGSAEYVERGKQEKLKGSIPKAIQNFKANPQKYVALMYQSDMMKSDPKQHQYTLLHRAGTVGWKPAGVTPNGWMTVLFQSYERCKALPNDTLPKEYRDKYTDSMIFQGRKIHSKSLKPVMPGRGMGCGDTPNLKIIGDVDPGDIYQGTVGDCWLLSGISALAEFDGAIKKLFRKTKNLSKMPVDKPNRYTVTLWDLKTWKEVDIIIDERLGANPDGKQMLLGAKPSEDGELWAPYLEKAVAVHCGGFDKVVGGQCTHGTKNEFACHGSIVRIQHSSIFTSVFTSIVPSAWSLLTGCKEQYTIYMTKDTGLYGCYGKFNNYESKWGDHANSPHDSDQTLWKMPWPDVGGGGEEEISQDELFLKMCAWDKINYIVGAGTKGVSDKESKGGLVDNHAYSVIESVHNAAGTGRDLIKVRNPWGKGEIDDGEFDDTGPGWDKYPQIKALLKPVVADDGVFWVTKEEFFVFFQTIFLCASNMTEYVEDSDHKH